MSTIEIVDVVTDSDLHWFFRAMGFTSRSEADPDGLTSYTHWQIPGAAFEVSLDDLGTEFGEILYAMEVLAEQLGMTFGEVREHIIDIARAARAAHAAVWELFFATVTF